MLRYFISVRGFVLALKYDLRKEVLVIGGHKDARDVILGLAIDYFKQASPAITWTQANKVRTTFPLEDGIRLEAFKRLEGDGVIFEAVKSLGRLMC